MLQNFDDWLQEVGFQVATFDRIWASHLPLDVSCIEHACYTEGVEIPWSYNQPRDLRTVKDLSRVHLDRPEWLPEHRADADAQFQTQELINSIIILNGRYDTVRK